MARQGVGSCVLGFALLAALPRYVQSNPTFALRLLQLAAVCLAFTSATVVNSLTACASLQCDDVSGEGGEHPELAKGRALGRFRSSGQLGRAIGPLLGKSVTDVSLGMEIDQHFCSMRILLDIRSLAYLLVFCCYNVRSAPPHEGLIITSITVYTPCNNNETNIQ